MFETTLIRTAYVQQLMFKELDDDNEVTKILQYSKERHNNSSNFVGKSLNSDKEVTQL